MSSNISINDTFSGPSSEILRWKKQIELVGIDCKKMGDFQMFQASRFVEIDELVVARKHALGSHALESTVRVLNEMTQEERNAIRDRVLARIAKGKK